MTISDSKPALECWVLVTCIHRRKLEQWRSKESELRAGWPLLPRSSKRPAMNAMVKLKMSQLVQDWNVAIGTD